LTQQSRPAGPANWAGNVEFRAAEVRSPRTAAELRSIVAESTRVRALGTGHSFSRIADTDGVLIATAGLPAVCDIDSAAAAVTVGAGVPYGDLAQRLNAAGWALQNTGSLPHISVGGACATGTHGSGSGNRSLASAVRALELVAADGRLVTLDAGADGGRFRGAVVGLGALGIVTTLTLDLVPAYQVRQYVYEDLPASELTGHFDEIMGAAYSVSVFTDWRGSHHSQVWLKHRDGDQERFRVGRPWHGARPADGPRHPVPGMPTDPATQQQGIPGPWHERLPHFRFAFTPSSGTELQSEYLLPRQAAVPAIAALAGLGDLFAPVLQIAEIRTVAADECWMSMCYRQDSVAFHFTWALDPAAVRPVVAAVEGRLGPLGARPHWGKVFGMAPGAVRARYPRWDDFRDLAGSLDPEGKFRNEFMDRYFPREDPGRASTMGP
jgi:alditol oxidase